MAQGIKVFSDHINFSEGEKQQAGVAWNLVGADMWQAWVNLNSAITERDDTETALNDLLRLKNDPQEAQIKVTQAEAAYQATLAEVEVAQAQLDMLEAGPRSEQIAVVEAQVKQAEAALIALDVQRDKHSLTAPVAGWVIEKVTHEGEMAVPGMTLLTLADLTNVTLTVYVPEPDIDTISIGQQVDVFVDAFPGKAFTGHITYISDEAEFTPKNVQTKEERINTVFAVKIKLENEDQHLKPGMPADAILSKGQPKL
jgi:multidrug resistance efflux pump